MYNRFGGEDQWDIAHRSNEMYTSTMQALKWKGKRKDDATSRLEGLPADAASVLAVALKFEC